MDRRSQSLAGHYNSRRLAHNGRASKVAALRPALSLESAAPTIQPLPRLYLDLSIEGIQVSVSPHTRCATGATACVFGRKCVWWPSMVH